MILDCTKLAQLNYGEVVAEVNKLLCHHCVERLLDAFKTHTLEAIEACVWLDQLIISVQKLYEHSCCAYCILDRHIIDGSAA